MEEKWSFQSRHISQSTYLVEGAHVVLVLHNEEDAGCTKPIECRTGYAMVSFPSPSGRDAVLGNACLAC